MVRGIRLPNIRRRQAPQDAASDLETSATHTARLDRLLHRPAHDKELAAPAGDEPTPDKSQVSDPR